MHDLGGQQTAPESKHMSAKGPRYPMAALTSNLCRLGICRPHASSSQQQQQRPSPCSWKFGLYELSKCRDYESLQSQRVLPWEQLELFSRVEIYKTILLNERNRPVAPARRFYVS